MPHLRPVRAFTPQDGIPLGEHPESSRNWDVLPGPRLVHAEPEGVSGRPCLDRQRAPIALLLPDLQCDRVLSPLEPHRSARGAAFSVSDAQT